MTSHGSPYASLNGREVRPGAWIVTGREAGGLPYDHDALIEDGWKTEEDPEKWENWEYQILMPPNRGETEWYGPYVVSLAGVGFVTRPAEPLILIPHTTDAVVIASYPAICAVDDELLAYFTAHPQALDKIGPRHLEELMATVYRNHGFEVEHLGRWNEADGGVDFLAVQRNFPTGLLRLAIQCKSSRNKVTAEPIRALMGVLDRFEAHKGVVVTSSSFTENALLEARSYFWRIELKDRLAIVDALKSALALRR